MTRFLRFLWRLVARIAGLGADERVIGHKKAQEVTKRGGGMPRMMQAVAPDCVQCVAGVVDTCDMTGLNACEQACMGELGGY